MTHEPWSSEWKAERLLAAHMNWKDCNKCPLHTSRENMVFGHGNPDADILIVSGPPTATEDESGISMDGPAGGLFTTMWEEVLGQSVEDLYFTNVLGCTIENGRDPSAIEKKACLPRLHEIIYTVDPLLIIALGGVALNTLVGGRKWSVIETNGGLFSSPHPSKRLTTDRSGVAVPGAILPLRGDDKTTTTLEYDVMGLMHPSYVLRTDPTFENTGVFQEGGPAYQVIDALRIAIKLVKGLKENYALTTRVLERLDY